MSAFIAGAIIAASRYVEEKTIVMMKRLLRNTSAFFLLVLFIGFWSSTHLFYHTHIVDGQIIVHSHPFGNSSSGHTSQELKLISILSLRRISAGTFPGNCRSASFPLSGRTYQGFPCSLQRPSCTSLTSHHIKLNGYSACMTRLSARYMP